ncbi:type I-E CRISPR-associated protein Cas5/CasD [Calidifontibacter sp. DB0510]|uniref:Type I-E CRISPR-associated protein Cas5/CasD n=1 Tax=Metallococcus carri TaxID=1656884 RepID=A0A967B6T1_9MICO|nr:type I-E CRISPR-associated protein Cas5/CasD [Metallococcus carri]NHN55751.1 type I-E CRISPR-associated protein Cas5/CasD [Metallococcus carri]NOP38560.1 type I-E CRISPR-associated protein Cas5/CasD [Calidifontibacter sp. DB2511S]
MTTLLLRLAAPTQAWAGRKLAITPNPTWPQQPHASARTRPTGTGLVGFVGCALGRERGTDMSDLRALEYLVREDQPGHLAREFRVTRRRDGNGRVYSQPLVEGVVDDAAFLVTVSGDRGLLEQVADALVAPRWPLYLGRREYPPTLPILLGLDDRDGEEVARAHPWLASDWYRRTCPPVVALSLYPVFPYRETLIPDDWLESVTIDNPLGREVVDFFAVVAGMDGR